MLSNFFCLNILTPLLLNKEVEFHKTQSPIDSESRFGFEGRIKNIQNRPATDQIIIIVNLEEQKQIILAKVYYIF